MTLDSDVILICDDMEYKNGCLTLYCEGRVEEIYDSHIMSQILSLRELVCHRSLEFRIGYEDGRYFLRDWSFVTDLD